LGTVTEFLFLAGAILHKAPALGTGRHSLPENRTNKFRVWALPGPAKDIHCPEGFQKAIKRGQK